MSKYINLFPTKESALTAVNLKSPQVSSIEGKAHWLNCGVDRDIKAIEIGEKIKLTPIEMVIGYGILGFSKLN